MAPKAGSEPRQPNQYVHIPQPTRHHTKLLGEHQRYTHFTSVAPHVAVAHQYTAVRYAQALGPGDRFRRAKPLAGIGALEFRRTPFCPQAGDRLSPDAPDLVSEDCLTCEIWVPADVGDQERARRPVFVWIHGGFLQWGHPSSTNAAELARRTGAVVVMPVYRLNLFGFLSCEEMRGEEGTVGNLGFWDQRLAVEWVARNIHVFGGDADRITIGGLSAGSYSAFQQVMYESYLPDDQAHIKGILMMSNGCGLQPKSLQETRGTFLALAHAVGLPQDMDAKEKLEMMRHMPFKQLVDGIKKVPVNSFRACTDGKWIRPTYMQDIMSGKLGRTLARRKFKIIIGEVKEENALYERYGPPKSYFGLVQRLTVEYPAINSNRLGAIYAPKGQLPDKYKSWRDLFGHVYADCQVLLSGRGLLSCLKKDLPGENVYRYRIYRRLKCADESLPPSWGVTHSSDMPIWFAGNGHAVANDEKALVDAWVAPLTDFLAGGKFDWNTNGYHTLRTVKEESWEIGVERDPLWDYYVDIWDRLFAARKKL